MTEVNGIIILFDFLRIIPWTQALYNKVIIEHNPLEQQFHSQHLGCVSPLLNSSKRCIIY